MQLELQPRINYHNKSYSLSERMFFYEVPGISIAIVKDFKLHKTLTYGIKDVKTREKVTRDTIFQAASISKPVTALIALKLFDEKILDLNEDANFYLEDYKIKHLNHKLATVAIKDLLGYTAGIGISGFPGYSRYEAIPTVKNILKGEYPSKTNAVMKEFDDNHFHYSGGAYLILQEIIENVTRKKFELVAREELFEKLNLKSLTFYNITKNHNFSSGHRLNQRVKGKYHLYPEKSAAGLWASPADLATLFIEVLNIYNGRASKKLISDQSCRQFFATITEAMGGHVGLGMLSKKINKQNYVWFGGWNEGYQSKLIFNSKQGFGMVAMSNSDKGIELIYEIFVSIAKKYRWKDLENFIF